MITHCDKRMFIVHKVYIENIKYLSNCSFYFTAVFLSMPPCFTIYFTIYLMSSVFYLGLQISYFFYTVTIKEIYLIYLFDTSYVKRIECRT